MNSTSGTSSHVSTISSTSDVVEDLCPNCGDTVVKSFCPNCGQEKTCKLLPVKYLFHEAFDEFFKLDSKFDKTIVPLLTKPGFLTNEYCAGRRVRYVSPFRFYFIISAIYFICFSTSHYDVKIIHGLAIGIERAHPSHEAEEMTQAMSPVHTELHSHIALVGNSVSHLTVSRSDRPTRHHTVVDKTATWFIKNQSVLTFLQVPIASFFLSLLYASSGRFYFEHLVFAVHVQTFLYLMLLPALLAMWRNVTYFGSLALGACYLYASMLRVYKQHPVTTLIKCSTVIASYLLIITSFTISAFLVLYNYG